MSQYALALDVKPDLVRVQVKYRGKWISISGATTRNKAERRLARLSSKNVHDTYQLTPVSPTPRRAR